MAGLVADYSSNSESSCDSDSDSEASKKTENIALPKPDFKAGSSDGPSVFVNPFVAADNAKIAILEKHVKMISTEVKMVNGKKICWNYRKNKCRFGHKCKYAHDSDLQFNPSKDNVSDKEEIQSAESLIDSKKQETSRAVPKKRAGSSSIFLTNMKVSKTNSKTLQNKNIISNCATKRTKLR